MDIDSWGKPKQATPAAEITPVEAATAASATPAAGKKPRVKRAPSKKAREATLAADRESVISRPSGSPATIPELKIMTSRLVAQQIKASKLDNMAGERSCKNWFLRKGKQERTGRARTGELDYLIEIFRQLRNEGYQ